MMVAIHSALTSQAVAGGRAIWSSEAGGVVPAGAVLGVTGVKGHPAQRAGEERGAGAGELPRDLGLDAARSVQAGRRVALVYVLAAV